MYKFTLWFSLYDKKMKTNIIAVDIEDAKRQLENKIEYHKITKEKISTDKVSDVLKKFFPNIKF